MSPTPASTPCPAPTVPANVLSIAGTDPTGGAGIQADLKTFGALGAYGMAVVTAVVAQNTQAVRVVSPLAPELVQAQLEAAFEDVTVAAVKIGMVANAGIAEAIAGVLARHRPPFVVCDPVMTAWRQTVADTGAREPSDGSQVGEVQERRDAAASSVPTDVSRNATVSEPVTKVKAK